MKGYSILVITVYGAGDSQNILYQDSHEYKEMLERPVRNFQKGESC